MTSHRVNYLALLLLPLLTVACSKGDVLMGASGPSGQDARPVKLSIEPQAFSLGFNESTRIAVRVLYLDNTPAADHEVSFKIDGVAGGASLLGARMVSGTDGFVNNELTAGGDKTNFAIVAEALTAESVRALVDVDGIYDGNIRVRFQYDGLIALQDITVRLHEGGFNCAGVDLEQPPQALTVQQAAGPSVQPVFSGLPEEQVYSVTATAIGPAGNVVATGCGVAPPVVGRSVVQVELPLGLFPENFEGVYDFGLKLHTQEALPGAAGQAVNDLSAFFLDPADVLADQFIIYMADQTGMDVTTLEGMLSAAWVFYAIDAGLPVDADGDGDLVDDAVEHYLLDRAPAWVDSSLTIGGDLTELMRNLTLGGAMEITSVDDLGALEGHWDWSDFLFMWRVGQGCDLADTCCGRQRYSGAEVGLAPMGADFSGAVTPRHTEGAVEYDMSIAEHRMDIQYGNILLFALQQFVLPALSGESTIGGAIESLFGCAPGATPSDPQVCGCERVGAWLDDAVGTSGVGGLVCDLAVTSIATTLENSILNLTFSGSDDAYFMMAASGIISDADLDLDMDEMNGGTVGSLFLNGDKADFTGELTGDRERDACVADSACGTGQACGVKLDVLNDCAGRQVCVNQVGDRVAGQACTLGTQCQSGVCATGGSISTCLTACGDNLDCPGSLSCGAGAASVELSAQVTWAVDACGL